MKLLKHKLFTMVGLSLACAASYAQVYSYAANTHELLSSAISGNTTNYTYTVGYKADAINDSFSSGDKTVAHDSNYYRLDTASGIATKHFDTNGNNLVYNYNNHGIKSIYYYKANPGSNGNIAGIKSSFNVTYTHNSFGEVTTIARGNKQDQNQGFSTFNIYGANGRCNGPLL